MFKNILIIGFGMIGSSIARTVVKNNKLVKVYALDKSPSIERRLKKAKLSSVICLKSFDEVDQKNIDLIIICTPVLQYKSIFHKISKLKHSKFIVTDVGSTKLNIEKIFDIKPKSFSPKPKIDSSLLVFTPKKNFFKIKDPKNLEKITRIFFNQRRKMIKKPFNQLFNGNQKIIDKLKIDLNQRPQNLDFNTYYHLTSLYENLRS